MLRAFTLCVHLLACSTVHCVLLCCHYRSAGSRVNQPAGAWCSTGRALSVANSEPVTHTTIAESVLERGKAKHDMSMCLTEEAQAQKKSERKI